MHPIRTKTILLAALLLAGCGIDDYINENPQKVGAPIFGGAVGVAAGEAIGSNAAQLGLGATGAIVGLAAGPYLQKRDLVFFDYRGTGRSEPDMSCPEFDALGPAAGEAAGREALLACRDRIVAAGVDLDQYHSAALAADAADVMRALGYERYGVFGVSYGTRVALTMLRDRPDGIEGAVLDSVYPPQVDLYARLVLHQQEALERIGRFLEHCSAERDGDPVGAVGGVMR